jgi:N-methylhydantoinase A
VHLRVVDGVTAGQPAGEASHALGGYIVGVDTGGTFTDAVIVAPDGSIHFDKAHSTPNSPAIGAMEAVRNAATAGHLDVAEVLSRCLLFAHGTTVGTNALIERRGARVGLLTSRGFEDTTLIGRGPLGKNMGIPLAQAMDFIHNERPEPIVDRRAISGVRERIDVDGDVVVALCEPDVAAALARFRELGIDSVAVSYLWSFRNDVHERRTRDLLRELDPSLEVSLSVDVAPVIGEFERATTTIVNAFVAPTLATYVDDLAHRLSADGLAYPLQLMTSSGGLVFPQDVRRNAVRLINGGPVGGLVAAQRLGRALGHEDVITADMGGTSFDVGLIRRGAIQTDQSFYVTQGSPVLVEAARVVTIGAGGGSIAASDGRRLAVGPGSAGAVPGPACYGRGGEEPTVTDALVVLGLLDPGQFFGGREALDLECAERAIRDRVAGPLGLSLVEAAAGIYEIVTSRMRDLIRQITVESGFDTRGFALIAYGGAAPLHAAAFSERLGLREVVVPFTSAVFSALGCALSDVRYAHARSAPMLVAESGDSPMMEANAVVDDLLGRVIDDMRSAGQSIESLVVRRRADVRYVGQMTEITLDVDYPLTATGLRDTFERAYRERYGPGTTRRASPIELVTYRVEAVAASRHTALREDPTPGATHPQPAGSRSVYLRQFGRVEATVYDGDAMAPGSELEGPALIERRDTTVWVPPDHGVRMDSLRNIRLSLAS